VEFTDRGMQKTMRINHEDARQGCNFPHLAHYFIAERDGDPLRLRLRAKPLGGQVSRRGLADLRRVSITRTNSLATSAAATSTALSPFTYSSFGVADLHYSTATRL
jgi:hypothetical protein